MVRQHHQLNGHEFEQTLGDTGGQRSLACCSPWGCRVRHDLVTEQQHFRFSQLGSSGIIGSYGNFVSPFEPFPEQLYHSHWQCIFPLAMYKCSSFSMSFPTLVIICQTCFSGELQGSSLKHRQAQGESPQEVFVMAYVNDDGRMAPYVAQVTTD